MSLTTQDLDAIRNIFLDAYNDFISPRFDALEAHLDRLEQRVTALELQDRETNRRLLAIEHRLTMTENELQALRNDIIELYNQYDRLDHGLLDKKFNKLSTPAKLIKLHTAIQTLAKHENIELS